MLRSLSLVLLVSCLAPMTFAATARPSLTVKPADLERARENIRRYAWARKYAQDLQRRAAKLTAEFTPQFVERMLEQTTPIATIFTPCPACRDQGRTWHPHGQWEWNAQRPEQLACTVCRTVFPSDDYPETVEVRTTWGTPQTFTFVGGEPFKVFSYSHGRPSLSGSIRARKVQYMGESMSVLGEAYLLSGEPRFAAAARVVLLRLAAVYPHWLIHSGYGEFADMDPRVAAQNMEKLPADEVVYPPNRPDRQLHTRFWTAGRATGVGQESHFLRQCVKAFDATCDATDASGQPIYSDDECRQIEEHLLREGTILLVADKQINNKSVGNRTAAAMIGVVLRDPELVRFGIEGFDKTLSDWFLPDGATSESPSYALMTLNNTHELPLALRGYSDPPGYTDADGKRLDDVDLYRDERYARAWSVLVDGLQGDCTYIPYADAYARKFDAQWADLLAAHHPDRQRFLSLLKALCGDDLSAARPPMSLYHREPGLEEKPAPPLSLPDFCPPHLRIGHMRTGADGRESLLVLSASHWGIHHHQDSLNLYYWKNGRELLSDLGYLWDNPLKQMTARTLAHNTVIVDEAEQERAARGGEVHFFKTSPHVKVMRASSRAYPRAQRYERTSAIIDHGQGRNYVVDFFTVAGGSTRDFVFHGPGNECTAEMTASQQPLYDLKNVRELRGEKIAWRIDGRSNFTARWVPDEGETAFIGDGWGQRDPFNKDLGATLPYIVRRTKGNSETCFVSVFEGHPTGEPFVKSIRRTADGVEVETASGRDYIVCTDRFSATSDNWTFSND